MSFTITHKFLRNAALTVAITAASLAGCSSPELAQAKDDGKGAAAKAATCTPAKLDTPSAAGLQQEVICLSSKGTASAITVEIAASPAEQAKGLMFRTELAGDKGMLFPFPVAKRASFWMKNTYIPLDIIFLTADGKIESIAANAEPTSLKQIYSIGQISYVLELSGGRAAQLGLTAGDQMVRAQ